MIALIERCRSGTLVSAGPEEFPVVIRLPLVLDRARGQQGVLFGALDPADPRLSLVDGGRVLAVFDPEPMAGQPPTGNPMSVDVRGRARLVGDRDRIAAHLARLDRPRPADPAGTVGIEIEIDALSGRIHPSEELCAVRTESEGQS
jgi:predicted FMN-binding regulatory protein PaiB